MKKMTGNLEKLLTEEATNTTTDNLNNIRGSPLTPKQNKIYCMLKSIETFLEKDFMSTDGKIYLIHGDVKLVNILYNVTSNDDYSFKIHDFDSCCVIDTTNPPESWKPMDVSLLYDHPLLTFFNNFFFTNEDHGIEDVTTIWQALVKFQIGDNPFIFQFIKSIRKAFDFKIELLNGYNRDNNISQKFNENKWLVEQSKCFDLYSFGASLYFFAQLLKNKNLPQGQSYNLQFLEKIELLGSSIITKVFNKSKMRGGGLQRGGGKLLGPLCINKTITEEEFNAILDLSKKKYNFQKIEIQK